MPSKKLRMRSIALSLWSEKFSARIYDRLHTLNIVDLAMNHDLEIIRKPDQSAIEHPVRGA